MIRPTEATGRRTYQSVRPKHLPALLTQLDLGHANLPPLLVPVHLDSRGPRHDLVPKAHADHLDPPPGGQRLARELDQLHDPLVVQIRGVLRPADEHGVDGLQVGIHVGLVDDVVAGDGEL